MPFEQHHLEAVAERGALHLGERDVGRLAERRARRCDRGSTARLQRRHTATPAACRAAPPATSVRSARTSAAVDVGRDLAAARDSRRAAVERHALGEDVGAPAEAAQALGAAREVGQDAAPRALQLGLGGALLQQLRDDGVHLALDARGVDAVLDGRGDHEQARRARPVPCSPSRWWRDPGRRPAGGRAARCASR